MRCCFLLAATVFLACSTATAETPVPVQGLRLHLDAGRGLQVTDGKVVQWRDQSSHGLHATAEDGFDCPVLSLLKKGTGTTTDSGLTRPKVHEVAEPAPFHSRLEDLQGHAAVSFRDRQLLKISGCMLPETSRSMTVLAVAKTLGLTGVGILSIRNGAVPLVQLDTDSHGAARFIVRDTRNRTLQSVGEYAAGRWGVFAGVLKQNEDGSGSIEVFFGDQSGGARNGQFDTPIVGDAAWIGALPLGDRLLSWNGEIAELLVYDRALPDAEREALAKSLCDKYGLRYKLDPSSLAEDVYPWKTGPKPVDQDLTTDVCVVGAGSAGIAAALAAARRGAKVVLVERQTKLGGTGANAFVSAWEPGPGCSIDREIFDRMSQMPAATGVAKHYPNATNAFSMGQWYVSPGLKYESSLRRAGVPREQMRCVPYDPQAMDRVVRDLIAETGRITLLDGTTFFHATTDAARTRIESILVEHAERGVTGIRAKVFIDSTGCIHLARAVGCEVMLGVDPRDRFDEPAAPERGRLELNAISRCYRVVPSDSPTPEPEVEPPAPAFVKTAHVTGWKDGPRIINPLPMLPGRALIDLGYERCMEITDKAVRAHWRWLQSTPDFAGYEFDAAAPMLGIRESYRLQARYVLTQHDLEAGLSGQTHHDIIAVADHPCDIHGAGGHLTAVTEAYGVPYRCLIPAGDWDNLLVACRGSGFSKIAASSCRLQRTMIQLGHAAGAAAAMAAEAGAPVDEIDVDRLVGELGAKGRVGEWRQ